MINYSDLKYNEAYKKTKRKGIKISELDQDDVFQTTTTYVPIATEENGEMITKRLSINQIISNGVDQLNIDTRFNSYTSYVPISVVEDGQTVTKKVAVSDMIKQGQTTKKDEEQDERIDKNEHDIAYNAAEISYQNTVIEQQNIKIETMLTDVWFDFNE